tara:strand:- start:182 stop:454 length:273 start_codon:yes stop_codon:yes gene_type:complete
MGSVMEVECPKEFYECLTEDEYDELLEIFEDNQLVMPETLGDGEAAANFVWNVLFLTPAELVYIGISMSVLAFYGLSIYYMYKKIQKKFS